MGLCVVYYFNKIENSVARQARKKTIKNNKCVQFLEDVPR